MSVKKMKDGRWYSCFRYKDGLNKTRQKKKIGFKTRKEAKEWEEDYRATHAGKAMPGMTYDDLAQRYFAAQKLRWRESTYGNVSSMYRLYIAPYIGTVMLDDISNAIALEYQNCLLADDRLTNERRKTVYSWAGSILSYGVQYFDSLKNPLAAIPFKLKVTPPDHVIWTHQQFNTFLRRIPSFTPGIETYELILYLLFYGGLRRGEVFALTVRDFDFYANTLTINKSRGPHGITPPKTQNSYRTVLMPQQVMTRARQYIHSFYEPQPDALIFPSSPNAFSNKFIALQDKYGEGLPHLTVHGLRHSHVSMLIDMGFTPQAVGNRIGDRAEIVLKVYAHMYDDRRKEIVDRLDDLLND